MILLFGLLLYAQIVSFSSQDNSIPVQCVFASPSLYVNYMDMVLLAATLSILLIIYMERMMPLFSDDPDWALSLWLAETCIQ